MTASSMATEVDVSILIPNWNGMQWLPGCLAAIYAMKDQDFDVIIIDNGSTDESVPYLKTHHPSISVVELPTNLGFSAAMNRALEVTGSPYIVFLNNDTEVTPEWLTHLKQRIKEAADDVVAVASLMCTMSDHKIIDDAGNTLSWYGAASKRGHGLKLDDFAGDGSIFSVSGGASLFKRSFLEEVGGFFEPYFAYLEDVDLGFSAQLRGYSMVYESRAVVYHKGQGSALLRNKYVSLITCNRLMLFTLNVPSRLLLKHFGQLFYGQMYFFIAYRKPWSSFKGYTRFLRLLPIVLQERKKRLKQVRIPLARIADALGNESPKPPLAHFLRGYIESLKKVLGRP